MDAVGVGEVEDGVEEAEGESRVAAIRVFCSIVVLSRAVLRYDGESTLRFTLESEYRELEK